MVPQSQLLVSQEARGKVITGMVALYGDGVGKPKRSAQVNILIDKPKIYFIYLLFKQSDRIMFARINDPGVFLSFIWGRAFQSLKHLN